MVKGLTHEQRCERRKDIAEYANKNGVAKAANKFNVSIGTVVRALGENELTAWGFGGFKPASPTSFEVLKMLLDGIPDSEVARQKQLSRQRVGQIKTVAKNAGFSFPQARSQKQNAK